MSQDNLLYKMSTTQKYDIPIAHLDYEYIEGCQDVKYLEKILRVLRSGDEGRYPEMEDRCEKRIDLLDPNSRVLRKETPMKKVGELDREEGKSIQNDLMEWSTGMKEAEIGLNGSSEFDDDSLPPVRSGSTCISLSGEVKKAAEEDNKKKAAMPRSYKEWDKFDVDKELETVEKETPKEKTKSAAQPVIENIIDSTGMSEREKEMKANREKDKGNEAFKAGDYQEAISYYSRSISLQPTAASYNNRALAYLKTKEWLKAETDCNKVLTLEPKNIKALLRRGTARKGKKCFSDAQMDFEEVLELEPNNKRAKDLIDELKKEEEKAEKEKKERKEKGRRMVIEEVEGEDEESADEEIIVDKKEDGKFENKKQSVSLKSEELNKNKIVNGNQHQNSLVNGFHESSNKTEENKEIWSEEEISGSGFKTVRTKSANDSNDNTSVENSEKVLKNRQENTQDSENHSQVPAEVENSENENKVNASAENEITGVDKSESEVKHECVNSDSKDKATESSNKTQDVILSRPVLIQGELPGPAGKLREKGNQLFKEGQYAEAVKRYSEAIQKLQKDKLDHTVNLSLLYSNRAACHLKTGDCLAAIKDCNMSLELVPHAIKPLLRRGNAYEALERYRMAYVDYKHVLNVDRTVDMAHQGSTRCQSHLQETDGPKWREKLPPIPSVSPWEIPDIRTEKESTKISSTVSTSLPQASTSSETRSSISSSSSSKSKTSQASDSKSSTVLSDASLSSSQPKKSKQESFDTIKARGNEFVKQGDFKKAIECYTMCIEKSPDQAVSYTNRALCYLRTNQAEQAEQDCTQALTHEPDNVKALFRRAQAKKMLKKFKESLSDLIHLLRVDPKNTAAQREIELVKDYWRAELRSRPKPSSSSSDDDEENSKKSTQNTAPTKKTPTSQTTQPKVSPNEKPSTKSNTQPKVSPNEKPSTKSNTKQEPTKGKQKSRKRMVIQEVESDASEGNNTSAGTKSTDSHQQGQTAAEKKIIPNSSQEQTTAKKEKTSKPTASGQQEPTGKKTKPDKTSQKHSSEKKDNAKSSSQKSSKSSTATSAKQATKDSQQAGQNASAGLPVVPPSVPKLEKATPYEFIQAWNSLKKAEDIQPYADLLRQIQPQDLPQVISNKLDGPMLNTITKCVAEKFVSQGEYDLSYSILKSLTNVPRFGTIAMFLSASDKKDIQVVLQKLQKNPSSVYGSNNIVTLKKEFGIKL